MHNLPAKTNTDVLLRIEGKAGRITLNRPDSLNALTYDMALAIEKALLDWHDDDHVQLILIDAVGEKSFCAGGDIQKMYDTGIVGNFSYMRQFWSDEYRLNALIANYPKPYIAMMNGIVMGGGVGISAHGSHRIVTQRTMLAMPECTIGLVPDVGGSLLLAKAPGHVGEFMGVTGARLDGADAVHAGFADTLINADDIPALTQQLIDSGNVDCIRDFAQSDFSCQLEQNAGLIETYFSSETALDSLRLLEESNVEWANKQAISIRRGCPLSIACTWQMIKSARSFGSIEQALVQEYRFTWNSMDIGDVLEGTRALIIDKDRNPDWKIKHLEEVSDDMIKTMLASLGENELNLKSARED